MVAGYWSNHRSPLERNLSSHLDGVLEAINTVSGRALPFNAHLAHTHDLIIQLDAVQTAFDSQSMWRSEFAKWTNRKKKKNSPLRLWRGCADRIALERQKPEIRSSFCVLKLFFVSPLRSHHSDIYLAIMHCIWLTYNGFNETRNHWIYSIYLNCDAMRVHHTESVLVSVHHR